MATRMATGVVRELQGGEPDVRRRLLDAASEEFAAKGYEGATVRDIVARAHANLNSINYYFGSKQELYVEVLRHQVALSKAVHPSVAHDPGTNEDPAAVLRRAVRQLVGFMLDPDSLLPRLYALELVNPSPAFESAHGGGIEQTALTGAVRALLGPRADAGLVTRGVRSVYAQCAYYMFVRKVLPIVAPGFVADPRMVEELTQHITEFSLGGLERLKPMP
ncbi:MAG: CerR family C-terminal domain-containing protein [Sinobacteraceae bacterium]|nr:CerR family C-terminal domain-containing protein [Nevskiaceae bacterium]MCP5467338.1 CerR family C-terminal domain-containing protein [Nevskiaceae bacterium]